jgi:hypothetical protein
MSLRDLRIDERGAASRDNLVYPPISLATLFADRPEMLDVLHSRTHDLTGTWFEVEGPYASPARARVLANLGELSRRIEQEPWVVPADPSSARVASEVRDAYEAECIAQWRGLLDDSTLKVPVARSEALETIRRLSSPERPLLLLLGAVDENNRPMTGSAPSHATAAAYFGPLSTFTRAPDDQPDSGGLFRYIDLLRHLREQLDAHGAKLPAHLRDMFDRDDEAALRATAQQIEAVVPPMSPDLRELLRRLLAIRLNESNGHVVDIR